MAKLLERVLRARDTFNVEQVKQTYPWIVERERKCIISPDADGQLCALLLTNILGWEVVGFYDGKALVCHENTDPKNAVFVDVEIFRQGVRSFGNHMLAFNFNRLPSGWSTALRDCISPNNMRSHDRRQFDRKYPFASIHFLLVILASEYALQLPASAAGPLLFADGVYKLLLQYTENAWDWMRYMGVTDQANPLHRYFHNPDMSVYALMTKMLEFWRMRDETSITGQRGDRIAITDRGGAGGLRNLVRHRDADQLWHYDPETKQRNLGFLTRLGEMTGWPYTDSKWRWDRWKLWQFEKGVGAEISNIRSYDAMFERQPISLAITAQNRVEYTVMSTDPDPFI
ncbi:MAG: hypothetical protein GC162_10605 [Planctomycetes bacterium]|nr:hypothetical protein [Planctomycetota bacterium]